MTYKHTPEMGEISGFGGSYEEACQIMLDAGVKWIQTNTHDDLKAKTLKNAYGLLEPTSEQAKALEKAILEPVEDATGGMHQAVMQRLFFIAKHGWGKYCITLTESERKENGN